MLRIAVIDDQPDIIELIALQLRYSEADVEVVARLANYNEVVAYPHWADVDAATIDWVLPGRDGTQVHAWLAANHPHLNLVIVTAAPSSMARDSPDFTGRVLPKPYDITDLLAALEGAHDDRHE